MAVSEESKVDSITVKETGHIEVRRIDRILKGDELVIASYHRHVISPGGDLSNEDPKVVAIAKAAWESKPTPKE